MRTQCSTQGERLTRRDTLLRAMQDQIQAADYHYKDKPPRPPIFQAHSTQAQFNRIYKKNHPKPTNQHMTSYEKEMFTAYQHSLAVQRLELQVQYNTEKRWHQEAIEQAVRDQQQIREEFQTQFEYEGLHQTPVHSKAEVLQMETADTQANTTPPDSPGLNYGCIYTPSPEVSTQSTPTPSPTRAKKRVTFILDSSESEGQEESDAESIITPVKRHKQLTLPMQSTPTKGAAPTILKRVRESLLEQVGELNSLDEEEEQSLLSKVADIANIQNTIKQQIETSQLEQASIAEEPEVMITYGLEKADRGTLREIQKHLRPINTLADGNCLYRAIAVSKHPQGVMQPGKVSDWPVIKNQIMQHHSECKIHHTSAKAADTELQKVMGEGSWGTTFELEAYCHLKGYIAFLKSHNKWSAINASEVNNPHINGVIYITLSGQHFSGNIPTTPNLHQQFFRALDIHREYYPTSMLTQMPAIEPPPTSKYPIPGATDKCVSDILGEVQTAALRGRFKRAYAKILQYVKHKWSENWIRCLYGYKCSNLYLDRQSVQLLSQTLFLAVRRDVDEIEAPFWWLVTKIQQEEQLSIKICQNQITPDTVNRAFAVPKWRLQEMYHGVAISALTKPTRQQFKKSQIACLKISGETLTYSFDQGQDLLLAAATVSHRHPDTPVPEIHSNWHYWSTQLKSKLAVNFFSDIGTDKHFDLKVEGESAPFLLPIFSLYGGFDQTLKEYRKQILQKAWDQNNTENLTELYKASYSMQSNAALYAAIEEGDSVFTQTTHPVLPHFAYGCADAAKFIEEGLPCIVAPNKIGESIQEALSVTPKCNDKRCKTWDLTHHHLIAGIQGAERDNLGHQFHCAFITITSSVNMATPETYMRAVLSLPHIQNNLEAMMREINAIPLVYSSCIETHPGKQRSKKKEEPQEPDVVPPPAD
jgi:hypothetical protein